MSDGADGFFPGSVFYIARREWIRPISRIGRIGERGVFQNVNVLFAMIGSGGDGSDISDISDGSEEVRGTGRTGSFSGGGAVMAPLRRAGRTGSLLFQGNRSD